MDSDIRDSTDIEEGVWIGVRKAIAMMNYNSIKYRVKRAKSRLLGILEDFSFYFNFKNALLFETIQI